LSDSQTPTVFTIPSGLSFLENLAIGLLKEGEKDPFRLSQMDVFLPTRRACIELKRALMRQGGGRCLLLPRLFPLGDLEEDDELLMSPQDELDLKPLIPPLQRLGLLTRLIEDYAKKTGMPSSPSLSFKLAKSLVRLMDQAAIENVRWEGVFSLVPSEFASHWQITLDFLEIITTHWPQILEEKGFIEPYPRHHQLVDLVISRWQKEPPLHPILAAGSTGTMPATARLLQAIASLPQGAVILPGLDRSLSEEEAQALSPCHPQYAPTRFLQGIGVAPQNVPLWADLKEEERHPRARLFADALKPSFSPQGQSPEKALENLYFVPCASPQEEAQAIAILLRQHLEVPHQRSVLITSDLRLAERVKEKLKRWGVEIDSSSGEALDQTPPGVFVRLCAAYVAAPQDHVALLSLLKHPLFRMGQRAGKLRFDIRQFETKCLRGKNKVVIPAKTGSTETQGNLEKFFNFTHFLGPCPREDGDETWTFKDILGAHRQMAEALSTDEEGVCQLWKGAKGEALRSFFDSLEQASFDFPSLTAADYPVFLEELLRGQSLRLRRQNHPRLAILGPIEARLFQADVMILGGLNEGTWPPDIDMDPWLNRPMRRDMGFPSPERRIGLSAHDFGQAFTNAKVYLTRALKVNGTQTLGCRWLERLEVYLKTWGLILPEDHRVLEWGRHLDQPSEQEQHTPPLPMPPLAARPRRLSVTQVETWIRDPYALYARTILSLSPLNPLNAEVTPADRGTLIHTALEEFFKICPDPHHKHALDSLLMIGKTLFEPYDEDPAIRLFWKPRFHHLARWFVETERRTRLPGTQTFTEVRGQITLKTAHGPFECTAKADRIDLLPDGRLRIIDYKTGSPPLDQDVILGFSPQLPLEGAIALHQGFDGISSTTLESLQFWWLKGDRKGGAIKTIAGDPEEIALKALAGLTRMIGAFDNEMTPYPACPSPSKAPRYNDYAHLERLQARGVR
jgi:ATP-dependent helicase/nuclease subunit B